MPRDTLLRRDDLITNPTARVPICLVLDNSPSMSGEIKRGSAVEQVDPRPIDELNEGLASFIEAIQDDDIARFSAEIAIVAFSSAAEVLLDFDSLENIKPPKINVARSGGTVIGKAVDLALQLLNNRKEEYQNAGVDYFQPWLVLMTDGRPTDHSHILSARKVSELVSQNKISVFPIAIGQGADLTILAKFSPKRSPLRLRGLQFKQFFEWLSKSVCMVSQSMPGEKIKIDSEGLKGWADLD